jgi:curved DNA-binding protein CbpA
LTATGLPECVESPFETLRVDPDAGAEEIEQAYRRRVMEAHPDHGGSTAEFQAVRAAYEALREGDGTRDRYRDPAVDPESGATGDGLDGTDEGDGDGPTDAEEDAGAEPVDPDPDPDPEVEYLNYDVLEDHGWSLDDDDLFEKAAEAGLDPEDHGRVSVGPRESLLEAAEKRGFAWPYACRGGACANCAVAVTEGDLSMPVDHILPGEMTDRGIRLSCVGAPTTEEARVVYNVKHLPYLDELRLPPRPFEQARAND